LIEVGFYDAKTEDVTDPKILDIRQPQVSAVDEDAPFIGECVKLFMSPERSPAPALSVSRL